jgi:hypothetical protein
LSLNILPSFARCTKIYRFTKVKGAREVPAHKEIFQGKLQLKAHYFSHLSEIRRFHSHD